MSGKRKIIIPAAPKRDVADIEAGIFRGVPITTEAIDRDGDIVRVKGADFEPYVANPQVLWSHNFDSAMPKLPVARATELRRGEVEGFKAWLASYRYPPKGLVPQVDAIHELDAEGMLGANSIGFWIHEALPIDEAGKVIEADDEGFFMADGFDIRSWEMWEFSKVPIPSNRLAVARRAAEAGLMTKASKELEDRLKDWADGLALTVDAEHGRSRVGYTAKSSGAGDTVKALRKTSIRMCGACESLALWVKDPGEFVKHGACRGGEPVGATSLSLEAAVRTISKGGVAELREDLISEGVLRIDPTEALSEAVSRLAARASSGVELTKEERDTLGEALLALVGTTEFEPELEEADGVGEGEQLESSGDVDPVATIHDSGNTEETAEVVDDSGQEATEDTEEGDENDELATLLSESVNLISSAMEFIIAEEDEGHGNEGDAGAGLEPDEGGDGPRGGDREEDELDS